MRKIVLLCAAGMSTSMLVTKMKKYAESEGLTARSMLMPYRKQSNTALRRILFYWGRRFVLIWRR